MPHNSSRVIVRNVKLCGARVYNDDGIDPCDAQDVLVSDCFFRTDDDCVALKGKKFDPSLPDSPVEAVMASY